MGIQTISNEASTPTTPAAGFWKIYPATDGMHALDSAGLVTRLVDGTSTRTLAQTAAVATVATRTVGASDASFEISANVLVTVSTTHNFTVTCSYTDEGGTARTITLNFSNLTGTIATTIVNTGGAIPYSGIPVQIRCQAASTITLATTGTFTSVTYNVEGVIKKLA